MLSPDWGAARTYLHAHTYLLSDAAEETLRTLVRPLSAQEDEATYQTIAEYLRLLRLCREHGIDSGYTQFLASLPKSDDAIIVYEDVAGLEIPFAVRALLAQTRVLTQPSEMLVRASLMEQALALVQRTSHGSLWATLQVELGNALALSSGGEPVSNLTRANAAYQNALSVFTREAALTEWAEIQNLLGAAFYDRARLEAGDERRASLDEAITAYRAALTVRTQEVSPAQWAMTQHNLAMSLHDRAGLEEVGDVQRMRLDEALTAYVAALTVRTRETAPAAWAMIQHNLGAAYFDRAGLEAGDVRRASLEAAIAAYRAALTVRTRETAPADWAMTQSNLAAAVADRARLEAGGERRASLDEAITALCAALTVMTYEAAPAAWATIQNNLAVALSDRARLEPVEVRRASLEAAIAAYRAALTVRTRETAPADWAMTQNNLAISLHDRAGLEAGDERRASLDEAITVYRAALTVRTRETAPVPWAATQNNLAVALRNRARLETGAQRRASLDEAVTAYRAALTVFTHGAAPTDWAMTQNNLAVALIESAEVLRGDVRRASLDEAVIAYRAALTVTTQEAVPAQWAMTQNNLATALCNRAREEEGDVRQVTLNEAIVAYCAALTVRMRETAPADWAMTQNNLGNALRNRAGEEEGDVRRASLDEAVTAYRAALTVFTHGAAPTDWAMTQNNLAVALKDRARLETGEVQRASLDEALAAYRSALSVFTRTDAPTRHRNIAQAAARLLFDESKWKSASELYTLALDAQDDLFALSLTARDRVEYLESGADVAAALAYALVRGSTQADAPKAVLQAAAALERGRARASGEALAREQAQLETTKRVAPELLQRFKEASELLARYTLHDAGARADAENASNEQAVFVAASAARQEYTAALAAIRAVQPDFLQSGDPISEAVALLRSGERLVYVASTYRGGTLILLAPNTITVGTSTDTSRSLAVPYAQAWWDERLTLDLVVDLLDRRDDRGQVIGGLLPSQYRRSQFSSELQRAMIALGASDGVLARLVQQVRAEAVHHLIVVPCGLLGLLPLHAALVPTGPDGSGGTETADSRMPLQDVVRVSYAPSARIWTASRRRAIQREQSAPDRLEALVVGNPLPLSGAQPLSGAEAEAAAVRQLVLSVSGGHLVPHEPRPLLDREEATRRAIISMLEQYHATLSHGHFACHGVVDLTHPERSGLLCANDARLMVRDLRDAGGLRFQKLRLVTLSACQTGLPGASLPDEVVSLPTAWLLAGASGVIGSLWPVSDAATVGLMRKFYELHLLDNLEPGDALWLAQRWLRGFPQWREEFLRQGAFQAAQGLDAHGMMQAIATARSEANPPEDDENEPDTEDEGASGTCESKAAGALWESARHWAAFAHYGA